MNRILLLLCIFMAFSCSKSENDDVSPEDIPDNSIASLYKRVRLATKDTVGLNIMSHWTNSLGDACKEGYLFTGIKQGKFWVGYFKEKRSSNGQLDFEEIASYSTKYDYNLKREVKLGYGEKDNIYITHFRVFIWGNLDERCFEMDVIGCENDEMNSRCVYDFFIIRDDAEKHSENTFYSKKMEWYDNSVIFWIDEIELEYNKFLKPNNTLYDKNGECFNDDLKITPEEFENANVIPISMEEGIFYKNLTFSRINIITRETLFDTKIDDVLSDARVTIEKTKEIGNEWHYKIYITNYDGTKEEREIQLNIETGEYKNVGEPELVTEVVINELKNNQTFMVGDELQLTCTVLPESAANKNISIKSSDMSVVSIDENLVLHANAKGTTTITITSKDGNASKDYIVKVGDISVLISCSVSSTGMSIGGYYTGNISCSVYNGSKYDIELKSVKIFNETGELLYTGGIEYIGMLPARSESETLSVRINQAYKPVIIWEYTYEGQVYQLKHNVIDD